MFGRMANDINNIRMQTPDADACEGFSLNETIALAEVAGPHVSLTKRGVTEFLSEEFGASVVTASYGNRAETGLPPVDVHYLLSDGGKKCFAYVYQTDGAVLLLLRLTEAYAESIREAGHGIRRSAFPNGTEAWYGIIVDDTYTEADVREILFDACEMAK